MLFLSSPRFCLRRLTNLASLLAVMAVVGCEAEPQISKYTVPKESLINQKAASSTAANSPAKAEPKQILGAIFIAGDAGWFFKAMDDPSRLGPLTSEIRKLVETAKLPTDESGEPTWTLPEGWTREPGNQFRFATIRAGADRSAPEISVSKLPGPEAGDEDAYVLDNVNRWRGQIGLAPLAKAGLASETEEIKAGDVTGVWVDMTGEAPASGAGMMAPFAGGAAGARPPFAAASGSAAPSDKPASGIKYETPEGWKEEPATGFRKASFKVTDGDQLLDVSVSDLAAQAGELLPNINRWRQQVKLPEITQEELEKQLQPIDFGGDVKGHFVELVGEAQDGSGKETILGAIAVHGDQAWFVKARGSADLAEREKQKFQQFVRSIQFE